MRDRHAEFEWREGPKALPVPSWMQPSRCNRHRATRPSLGARLLKLLKVPAWH